jgi:hypothetical protein
MKFLCCYVSVHHIGRWTPVFRNIGYWTGTGQIIHRDEQKKGMIMPGGEFGDESSWIVDAATLVSKGHKSVTILINGGEVSRKDIDLSLKMGRPVIALSRTGRLADELSREFDRDKLITIAPATSEQRIIEVVKNALAVTESSMPIPSLISTS